MKWNNHIKYLSSKLNTSYYMISSLKNVMSTNVLRTIYIACFHVHWRYGLTLWGGNPQSIRIFQLQKESYKNYRQSTPKCFLQESFQSFEYTSFALSVYK